MQTVVLPEIGEVHLYKRPNARSLRITLGSDGKVKVTLPKWVPYKAGIAFVNSKKQWVIDNLQPVGELKDGMAIGKFHHLYFISIGESTSITTRQKGSQLIVYLPSGVSPASSKAQTAARRISIKALRDQGEKLLPQRLRDLADKHGYEFKSVSVRQLKARWGSCDHNKDITLNLFLMMLPWDLIDYVLLHELTHTKALHHGPEFWSIFEEAFPGAKTKRKMLKDYKPNF